MKPAICLGLLLAAGCSDTVIHGIGHDGGGGGGGIPDGFIAAGPGSDGGTDGGGGSPDLAQPLDGYGTVYVYLTSAVSGTTPYSSTSVGASFYLAVPTTGTGATCTTTAIGECDVTSCTGTGSSTGTPPAAAAGTVTVSGGTKTVTIPTTSTGAGSESSTALYWSAGQTLSISATGATVPAFSDSLVIPGQIIVSAPYLPATGSVSIVRTSGLTLTWASGSTGDAVFTLGAATTGGSTSAVCRYPASLGSAAMPATVLSKFPAGSATFSASVQTNHEKRVGAWLINVMAYYNAIYDTGRQAAGTFTLN